VGGFEGWFEGLWLIEGKFVGGKVVVGLTDGLAVGSVEIVGFVLILGEGDGSPLGSAEVVGWLDGWSDGAVEILGGLVAQIFSKSSLFPICES
jgi:hypothetical protein